MGEGECLLGLAWYMGQCKVHTGSKIALPLGIDMRSERDCATEAEHVVPVLTHLEEEL